MSKKVSKHVVLHQRHAEIGVHPPDSKAFFNIVPEIQRHGNCQFRMVLCAKMPIKSTNLEIKVKPSFGLSVHELKDDAQW